MSKLSEQFRVAALALRTNSGGKRISQHSVDQYRRDAMREIHPFEVLGCKDIQQMPGKMQEYVNGLVKNNVPATTVRVRFSAICKVLNNANIGVQVVACKKGKPKDARTIGVVLPKRVTGIDITKGRRDMGEKLRPEQTREAAPEIWGFARTTGLRRNEIAQVRGCDLVRDESGYWCIQVTGKGDKYQKQRIEPGNLDFVRSYFNGGTEKVFSEEQMAKSKNQNLHGLRREHAQEVYARIKAKIEDNPKAAKRVYNEIFMRITTENEKRKADYMIRERTGRLKPGERLKLVEMPTKKQMAKPIILRGGPRALAAALGRPIEINRLAALYTSVFALSHWDNKTLCKHYIN